MNLSSFYSKKATLFGIRLFIGMCLLFIFVVLFFSSGDVYAFHDFIRHRCNNPNQCSAWTNDVLWTGRNIQTAYECCADCTWASPDGESIPVSVFKDYRDTYVLPALDVIGRYGADGACCSGPGDPYYEAAASLHQTHNGVSLLGATDGITCVCDPERSICQHQLYVGRAGGSTGGGSDVTVSPAGHGPSGPSFTSGYEFVVQSFTFSLPSGEVNSIPDLLGRIGLFFYTLAFPIAVILIIWAGIIMLTSGGNQQRIALGKRTLKYTLIGLAAVIIARGFFTLVVDLLGI